MNRIRSIARVVSFSMLGALLTLGGSELRAQFIAPAPVSSEGLNVPRPLTTDPAILYPAGRELVLMSGDVIRVSIFGTSPTFDAGGRITLDGSVSLPLAGTMRLAGLSISDAEAAIAARMEQLQMYRNPQVVLQVTDGPGHSATVLGGVKDGLVPIIGHRRLYDVLATSGGVSPSSSPIITIDRPGVTEPIVVNLGSDPSHSEAANVPIFAGDTVTLGSVGGYYVVGAVKTPGLQKLSGVLPTTAIQAIAVSGGVIYAAKSDSTRLIRTVGTQRTVVPIPLKKVLKGEAPDPILQADDILFVPTSRLKQALNISVLVTLLGLAITAISVTRY